MRRVVLVSSVLVAAIVVVGALAASRYHRSSASYKLALAARTDRENIEEAGESYWHERAAMLLVALGRGPSSAVASEARHLRSALGMVVLDSAEERALVTRSLDANRSLVVAFEALRRSASGPALVTGVERLPSDFERPLDRLLAVNAREVTEAEQRSAHDDRVARMFAIVAGAILVLAAIGASLLFGRLVRRIARQNAGLRRLDRLKDELIATVSHELRTPLTSIRGYVELLLDEETGPLTEEQRRFLSIADRSSDRLLRVVSDLLFVAQLDAASLRLELEPMELEPVVARAVEAAQPAAELKGLTVALTSVAPLPEMLGDAPRLAQVFDNLISNAVKFTQSGGVAVSLRREGNSAIIEVADTGVGIAADEFEHLFDRFFRATTATTGAVQGVGLGLAIAKAIVDGHGGDIGVASAEGVGTTFTVRLPLDHPGVETRPRAPAMQSP